MAFDDWLEGVTFLMVNHQEVALLEVTHRLRRLSGDPSVMHFWQRLNQSLWQILVLVVQPEHLDQILLTWLEHVRLDFAPLKFSNHDLINRGERAMQSTPVTLVEVYKSGVGVGA